jgi:hypothetical protein
MLLTAVATLPMTRMQATEATDAVFATPSLTLPLCRRRRDSRQRIADAAMPSQTPLSTDTLSPPARRCRNASSADPDDGCSVAADATAGNGSDQCIRRNAISDTSDDGGHVAAGATARDGSYQRSRRVVIADAVGDGGSVHADATVGSNASNQRRRRNTAATAPSLSGVTGIARPIHRSGHSGGG